MEILGEATNGHSKPFRYLEATSKKNPVSGRTLRHVTAAGVDDVAVEEVAPGSTGRAACHSSFKDLRGGRGRAGGTAAGEGDGVLCRRHPFAIEWVGQEAADGHDA